jgi:hypothetical protein
LFIIKKNFFFLISIFFNPRYSKSLSQKKEDLKLMVFDKIQLFITAALALVLNISKFNKCDDFNSSEIDFIVKIFLSSEGFM